MSTVRLGINGFGRIGRLTARSALGQPGKARVMAINDPFMDLDYLMYLLRYDSVHGTSAFQSLLFDRKLFDHNDVICVVLILQASSRALSRSATVASR